MRWARLHNIAATVTTAEQHQDGGQAIRLR
jgi:hypothetical protein